MVNRAIAYATAIVILALGYYQYLSTTRLSDVQKRYRRVADQAEIIKAQEQKIDSEQEQIASLQHQLQTQNDGLQVRMKRVEGQLRAQKQLEVETAEAHHTPTLRIYPLWISKNGAVECSPTLGEPCDVFELGREVHIGVTLTNISGHPITYQRVHWFGPPTFFVIRDKSGQVMPEAEELKKLREEYPPPDDMVLKPEGQVSWGVQVNKYWDMSRPGTYSIVAKLRSDEPDQKWFYSNRVRVTLTPNH
jgi:hypothetical protein